MTEERFEEFLQRTLDELEPVPTPPRDAMWAQIEQTRRFARPGGGSTARRVWINWGVGLAAMLAIGVGIGRLSVREAVTPQADTRVAAISDVTPNRTTYQVAVAQHLSRADALLTSFRTQPESAKPDPQLAQFARDLLTSTQLLLDSPAGDDPKVAALLGDLELILAQIARMSVTSPDEREIIKDGMNRTAVLPRLRATTSGPTAAGT
jgi:hypothetical protein